jgi:hypothetical protein
LLARTASVNSSDRYIAPPSPEEIEHWRDVALGRQRDD